MEHRLTQIITHAYQAKNTLKIVSGLFRVTEPLFR